MLDILLMYGAYATTRAAAVSRIFIKFLWFSTASVVMTLLYVYAATVDLTLSICLCIFEFNFMNSSILLIYFLCCRKALQERNKSLAGSLILRVYVIIIAIYAGVMFFMSVMMRLPACHSLTNSCSSWTLVHFLKWMNQVFLFL